MCMHVYVTHKVLDGAAFNDFQLRCLGKKRFLGVLKCMPGVRSLAVDISALNSVVIHFFALNTCYSVSH